MTRRLIKEATKDSSKGDFFRSSGYARAQAGAHIGAASTQSFKKRQKLAREFVKKYDNAQLNRDAAGRQADILKRSVAKKNGRAEYRRTEVGGYAGGKGAEDTKC